jgi:arylsulfatase A-like enzyme
MKRPPRLPTVLPVLILLVAALLLGSCSRAKEDAGVFRVIDRIGAKNVVASPFRAPDPKNPSLAEIAGKFPLQEIGSGENPFGIKMKLHLGPSDVNALAAAPPTTIAFGLKVPPGARFEFNYGIRCDEEVLHAAGGGRTAGFAVLISAPGLEETLFRRTVRLEPGRALAFNSGSIDLSRFAGRDVSFRLVTEGDERALAFWFNPVLYAPRKDARFVILISLDTLRADHLGCYGYDRDTSPNIDQLARDGVRFTETRAASPWTLPSHLSMMTALDTINHGVFTPDLRLDPRTPTLAELLKAKGFYNAAFTGGGYVSGFFGFSKGFDSFRVLGEVTDRAAAAKLAYAATRWIEKNADRNFFLFLHTYQIHNPYYAEEPWHRRYLGAGAGPAALNMVLLGFNHEERFKPLSEEMHRNIVGSYDGEISYTDERLIGPLVAKLKALGIYDRTMIVLTSDHGEEFFEHRAWLHTHSVYDEVLRVPLIVKFFGSRNAGRAVRSPAFGVDVMPTVAEELGLRLPSGDLDGKSLLRLADGGDEAAGKAPRLGLSDLAPQRAMKIHIPRKVALVRPPYKLIVNEPYSPEDLAYFLSPPPPMAEIEIFDVSRDPGETRNLAAERPELLRELRAVLRERYKPRKRPGTVKVEMDDDLLKQLKSLGYL